MAFDGVEYGGSDFIPPFASHPNAPLAGVVGQEALQGAYYIARHGAKMMVCQSYGWNGVDANRTGVVNHIKTQSVWVRVLESYMDIPALATHLVAACVFAFAGSDEHSIDHRIVITDGTDTDTGETVTIQADASEMSIIDSGLNFGQSPDYGRWTADPWSVWPQAKLCICEVALDDLYSADATGVNREVYVETKIEGQEANNLDPAYRPAIYWVGYEVRG